MAYLGRKLAKNGDQTTTSNEPIHHPRVRSAKEIRDRAVALAVGVLIQMYGNATHPLRSCARCEGFVYSYAVEKFPKRQPCAGYVAGTSALEEQQDVWDEIGY